MKRLLSCFSGTLRRPEAVGVNHHGERRRGMSSCRIGPRTLHRLWRAPAALLTSQRCLCEAEDGETAFPSNAVSSSISNRLVMWIDNVINKWNDKHKLCVCVSVCAACTCRERALLCWTELKGARMAADNCGGDSICCPHSSDVRTPCTPAPPPLWPRNAAQWSEGRHPNGLISPLWPQTHPPTHTHEHCPLPFCLGRFFRSHPAFCWSSVFIRSRRGDRPLPRACQGDKQ